MHYETGKKSTMRQQRVYQDCVFHEHTPQKTLNWIKCNLAWYRILDSFLCGPSLCCLLGSVVSVGLSFSTSHPPPSLLLFFLFVQQTIVESHPSKQEETRHDEEDSTALVCVLVIMIDVFELPCTVKKSQNLELLIKIIILW